MQTVEDRAAAVLAAIGAPAITKAASGRYRRSEPILPGVRYWSTSTPRRREDHVGVQFYGVGVERGRRLRSALERKGFRFHRPQPGQLTFARPVLFTDDDGLDVEALRKVRADLDGVILAPVDAEEGGAKTRDFWTFMKTFPLKDEEFELPERNGAWRDISFLFEEDA